MSSMSPARPGDSSRIEEDNNDDNDAVGDLSLPVDQQRHLMELESSFHIDSDALNMSRRVGDMIAPPPPNRLPPHQEESDIDTSIAVGDDSQSTIAQRARSSSTAAIVGEMSSPTPEDIKNFEDLTSSPTAAAHARNMSRAATAASTLNEVIESQGGGGENSPRASEIGIALDRRPSVASSHGGGRDYGALSEPRPPSAATNPRSTSTRPIQNSTSSSTLNQATTVSVSAGSSYKRRPKILRSRETSQRSSMSSVNDMQGLDDDESTLTLGEERQALSRQTSLGSIASGITALGGGSVYGGERTVSMASAADRALARLDEEERNSRRGSDEDADVTVTAEDKDKDRPCTPKERAPPLQQPTETAVTAQVKNVRVPPTIAREYSRHLGAPGSPSKKAVAAAGTPATGRGREMTLKEQTASIDRLQKENFDLKIKVYYLNEKLEKQSDEGVKEALQENVDLKVKLAESMRERKSLKRRVRELEKKVEELGGEKQREEEASAAAESDEIWELKERIERYELEIEEYRRKDAERNERMRDFRRQASNGHQANEEQLEQLRDLLTSEAARREAQETENMRLREEIFRLRANDQTHLSRTSISRTSNSRSVSERDQSQSRSGRDIVTQLNQARRENEELRRDLSAQASMLTSRNREKDRLYAEIEDLKLTMRGGGSGAAFESASRAPSVFSDRLLERSVSRAGGIQSAAGTHVSSAVTETEREEFENTNGALRDRISELRLANQDLQQRLESCYAELEQRQQEQANYEDELERELQEMQADRNDALRQREEIEQDFDQLKEEAEEEIQRLEDELSRLEEENRLKDEDFRGLQQELRNVSDVVVRLEDLQEVHQGETRRLAERIQELERTILENEQEMNVLENSLREANEKIERLNVQGESAKGEIQFLREEQDGDKIKIGQLESTIKQFEKALEDEKDRVREARQQLESERNQREQHGDIRQQEWEHKLNEKSTELTNAKDEVRRLKGKVCSREDEAKTWRERLEELERGLREALGDLGGTRTGLMQVCVSLLIGKNLALTTLSPSSISNKNSTTPLRNSTIPRASLRRRIETLKIAKAFSNPWPSKPVNSATFSRRNETLIVTINTPSKLSSPQLLNTLGASASTSNKPLK
ncbi:hypothetical protein BDD12DRAFT_296437 [Trichophaea hybrida]|nr:hypothetical protein BDD12DRAFT_296437 [Trichophaea hybrida]